MKRNLRVEEKDKTNEKTADEGRAISNETISGKEGERMVEEKIVEIELERLRSFKRHPFKVKTDQQMIDLMGSIEQYGILTPLIVRPLLEGVYEIISGHRRKYAAQQLGYRKVPVIIRTMRDEDAVISMIDANLNREVILPSEKAFAIKMKYDALKRKTGRKKRGQEDYVFKGKKTVQILGESAGESPKQIQRYIKITELIPEMLDKLDQGKLAFNPAYEIAFVPSEGQRLIFEAMGFTQSSPSVSQAQRIKALSRAGKLTRKEAYSIMGEVKKGEISRVIFKNEQLYQFFPRDYSAIKMKEEILRILTMWREENESRTSR